MKTALLIVLSLALVLTQGRHAIMSKTPLTADDDSKLFAFGILTEGLNYTWDQTFLDYVNSSNLNTSVMDNSLVTLSQYALNDTSKRPLTLAALNDIRFTISNFIQSVFPSGPFGNYSNIYQDLLVQEQIYNNPDLYIKAAQELLATGFDVEGSYQSVIYILKNTSCTPDAAYAWSRINNYILAAESAIQEREPISIRPFKDFAGFLVNNDVKEVKKEESKCIFSWLLSYLYNLFV